MIIELYLIKKSSISYLTADFRFINLKPQSYRMEKHINSKIIRKRDEYDSISTGSRRALIKLIFEHNVSIRIATNYLGLKYSTGKTLVQQYRRTGVIDRVKK